MLTKQLRKMFGFDIWQKIKYPQNPNLTNFSSDSSDPRPSNAWVGRVFVPKSTARKDPVSQYKDEAIRIVFKFLNQKHGDQFTLQFKDYEKVKKDTWFTHKIKLDQEIDQIVDNLCEEMILKEHSFRHALEKINRRKLFETYMIQKKNDLKSISVQEFIYEIARICEESVVLCHKSRDDLQVYETKELKKQILLYQRPFEMPNFKNPEEEREPKKDQRN